MSSMVFHVCSSVIFIFLLISIVQASLFEPSESEVTLLDRLKLENDLRSGASLIREILERNSNLQLQDLERLTEPFRSKRCRWKLCGTGRRFRYA